jgi:hypothetical protein
MAWASLGVRAIEPKASSDHLLGHLALVSSLLDGEHACWLSTGYRLAS